ncbi:ABC transporter ATP-binding protein [Jatrophihabitans telluris]|uniref:ABC transporter ATP-binding protein n=2 Tax=Jatrophihabitans telluris TaxID=2038343 RepID=A0ABY4QU27_9ACTN|nr:ABC transporter ATP-binding protein [Jatrophihabitans telluris]UQX86834.1 ABC transporter ATP-binding protein [Jatrophihabitans telluris]
MSGDYAALDFDVSVEREEFRLDVCDQARPGEVLGVLGPNGAGKTTLLRALAGLQPLRRGRIELDGMVLTDVAAGIQIPPERRELGVVFQNYRLFPHLSLLDNVGFGLRSRGISRSESRLEAANWLRRLDLAEYSERRPGRLSGGQAQRVALARALACRPRALLLDEPLAALDARTRLSVRAELVRQLRAFPAPALLITHDPLEAMVLTDRLLVLESGRVVQTGTPAEIARRPATNYIARLVGLNLYRGRLERGAVRLAGGGALVAAAGHELASGANCLVAVRPSAITLHTERPAASSARNLWSGTVRGLEPLLDRIRVEVAGEPGALVDITAAAAAELQLSDGTPVWLSAKATDIDAYPEP